MRTNLLSLSYEFAAIGGAAELFDVVESAVADLIVANGAADDELVAVFAIVVVIAFAVALDVVGIVVVFDVVVAVDASKVALDLSCVQQSSYDAKYSEYSYLCD